MRREQDFSRFLPDMDDRVGHDFVHARVDLFFAPEEAGHILYPFEVADGYAACVTDHVRYHKDTTAGQNIISIRIGRAVSPSNTSLHVRASAR